MVFDKGRHIYMASPFFNDVQSNLCGFIESRSSEDLPIYSPRNDGFILVPDSPQEDRQEIFNSNVHAIKNCSFILAVIDEFDPGTIWEMGYGHGIGKPCVAYSDVKGRGLNVMLAGSAKEGFINGRKSLDDFLNRYALWGSSEFPMNTWVGDIQ